MSGDEDFFSVASTIPLVADTGEHNALAADLIDAPFMPKDVTPWLTALRAYSAT